MGRNITARRSGVSKIGKVDARVKNILAYSITFFPHVNAVLKKVWLSEIPKLI